MSSSPERGTGATSGFHTPVGTRRKFFQWVTRAAAGLIGVSLAIPLVGYVVSPALKRRDKPWVEVSGLDELKAGEPKQLDYVATIHDGYVETKMHKAVWAVKQSDGKITVFSPMCTHLGCGYAWDNGEKKFKCPCHGSVFDVSGKVVAGPAPRRLDQLPSKVENGRLLVVYKEFKSGAREQAEL